MSSSPLPQLNFEDLDRILNGPGAEEPPWRENNATTFVNLIFEPKPTSQTYPLSSQPPKTAESVYFPREAGTTEWTSRPLLGRMEDPRVSGTDREMEGENPGGENLIGELMDQSYMMNSSSFGGDCAFTSEAQYTTLTNDVEDNRDCNQVQTAPTVSVQTVKRHRYRGVPLDEQEAVHPGEIPEAMMGLSAPTSHIYDTNGVVNIARPLLPSFVAHSVPAPQQAPLPARRSKRGRPHQDLTSIKNEAEKAKNQLKDQLLEIGQQIARKRGKGCEELREKKSQLQAEFRKQKAAYDKARNALNHRKYDRGLVQKRQDKEERAEELKQKVLGYYYEVKQYVEMADTDHPAVLGCCQLHDAFNWVTYATEEERNSQPDPGKAWVFPARERKNLSKEEIHLIRQENHRRFKERERKKAETAEEKIKEHQGINNVLNDILLSLGYHVEEANYAVEVDPLPEIGAEEVVRALPTQIVTSDQALPLEESVNSMQEEENVPDFDIRDNETKDEAKERIEVAIAALGDILGFPRVGIAAVGQQGDFLERYLWMQGGQVFFDKMGVWKRAQYNCNSCDQRSPQSYTKMFFLDDFPLSPSPSKFASLLAPLTSHTETFACPHCHRGTLNLVTSHNPAFGSTHVLLKIPSHLGEVAFPRMKEQILGRKMEPVFFLVSGPGALVTPWKREDGKWLLYDNAWKHKAVPKKLAHVVYIVFKKC